MEYYSDLEGFYSDLMGYDIYIYIFIYIYTYIWDIPSGND